MTQLVEGPAQRREDAVALQQEWVVKWETGGPKRGNMPPMLYFQCLDAAAASFDKLGKHELAEPIHRKLVSFVQRPPGQPVQAAYTTAVKLLVANLEKQGKDAEADELRKECLTDVLKRAQSLKAVEKVKMLDPCEMGNGEEAKI